MQLVRTNKQNIQGHRILSSFLQTRIGKEGNATVVDNYRILLDDFVSMEAFHDVIIKDTLLLIIVSTW